MNESPQETSYIPNMWDLLLTYVGHKTSWGSVVGGKESSKKISTNIQNNNATIKQSLGKDQSESIVLTCHQESLDISQTPKNR